MFPYGYTDQLSSTFYNFMKAEYQIQIKNGIFRQEITSLISSIVTIIKIITCQWHDSLMSKENKCVS